MSRVSQWLSAFEGFTYTLLRPLLLCNTTSNRRVINSRIDTYSMSDEQLAELAISAPMVDAGSFHISRSTVNPDGEMVITRVPNVGSVARITANAVAKRCSSDGIVELLATNLVHENTGIPVALCDRLVKASIHYYLVQEYIPGRTVWSVWSDLGWWKRFRIALTLRYYIYQLRSMSLPKGTPVFPGPPAVEGEPQRCEGRLFTSDGSGPFHTYRELSRWYQNRLLVVQMLRNEGFDVKMFDDSEPLVFTHFDLHPQNLILGDDGQLWIIDWANAGWYPPWFEGASMDLFTRNRKLDNLPGWVRLIPFIAGNYKRPGQLPFILAISYALEVLKSNIINLIDRPEQE